MRYLALLFALALAAPAAADTCPALGTTEDLADADPGGGPGPASSPLALGMVAVALLGIGKRVEASR